jgi:uncharacterized membrane protein YphA (DoxX/SURF4 family)
MNLTLYSDSTRSIYRLQGARRLSQKGWLPLSLYWLRRIPRKAQPHCIVQRLFSMFPSGLPGFALLLLRASVALAILLEGYAHRQELSGLVLGALVLLSATLCMGFLTPLAAALALVFQMVAWASLDDNGIELHAVAILDALALALLGPGAYSVDAYRFGRRIVLPNEVTRPR